MVVICGRNKKLLQRLGSREWPGRTKVVPLGFVDNMHDWMMAVDTIITKAGPGTIAEALICGLPILLNGNIPCQVGVGKLEWIEGMGEEKEEGWRWFGAGLSVVLNIVDSSYC